MNYHQKLVFIIQNESQDPEWVAERVGWSVARTHEEYHRAFEEGSYLALKAEKLPDVDIDLFVERLRKCVTVDSEHSVRYWSERLDVEQRRFLRFFTGKSPTPPSLWYVEKIAGKLRVKADWLAGRV